MSLYILSISTILQLLNLLNKITDTVAQNAYTVGDRRGQSHKKYKCRVLNEV